jgi:hypothetical protein
MEKRTTDRLKKRLTVRFGPDKAESLGFTGDLSGTGIFIKSSTVFPPGCNLLIEITLPSDRVLKMTGQVVWAKRVPSSLVRYVAKSGMGILLNDVPDDYYFVLSSLGV